MGSLKEAALAQAKRGFHVFRLKENDKTPMYNGWQQEATTNLAEVEQMWAADPNANIGISAGQRLTILDIDRKNGVDGLVALKELQEEHGTLPETYTVRTPTGGYHRYFLSPATGNTQKHLGEGLDTRGKGGYVVGWGSVIDGKTYDLLFDFSAVNIPKWMLEMLPAPGEKAANRDEILVEQDTPEVIQQAFYYKKHEAPTAEQGNRDNTAYKVAARFRGFGATQQFCYELLSTWNEEKCSPPLEDSDIQRISESSYRTAQNPAGFDNPEAQFEPIEVPANVIDQHAFNLEWPDEEMLTNVPKREVILGTRYVKKYVTVTAGPGGSGKSMLVMLEALAVATGRNLTGVEPTITGKVLIYNTEDPIDEIVRRLTAMCLHHGIPWKEIEGRVAIKSGRDRPLIIAKDNGGAGATTEIDATRLRDVIKDEGFLLVVLDPFVGTHRVNENDNNAIALVATTLSAIADTAGCAISLVHHTRKRAKSETVAGDVDFARGASALPNAARVVSTVTGMGGTDEKKFGLPEGNSIWYLRLDSAKGNLAPPAAYAEWYRKVSVLLPNGDSVGTIEFADLKPGVLKVKEAEERQKLLLAQHLEDCVALEGETEKPARDCAKYLLECYPHIYDFTVITMVRFMRRCLGDEGYELKDKAVRVYGFERPGKTKHWIGLENTE